MIRGFMLYKLYLEDIPALYLANTFMLLVPTYIHVTDSHMK